MPATPDPQSRQVSDAAQYKALGHPLRQRLLFALSRRSATISQLAAALEQRKGNVAHHLGVLREAGLVHVAETRQVRGGTEQYYQRTGPRIDLSGSTERGEHAPTSAMFRAIADEIAASGEEPTLALRHLRLTRSQADRLAQVLLDVVDEAEDAGDEQPRYGVLVSLYRQPEGTGRS